MVVDLDLFNDMPCLCLENIIWGSKVFLKKAEDCAIKLHLKERIEDGSCKDLFARKGSDQGPSLHGARLDTQSLEVFLVLEFLDI